MNFFGHETTPTKPIPTAAESRSLSEAHQLMSVGATQMARRKLFQVFGPADAEKYCELIRQRLASKQTPPAPSPAAVQKPPPLEHPRIPPVLRLVKIGLVVSLGYMIYYLLNNR